MSEDPAVLEAERFERSDLQLLLGRDTVHGRDHREDRDQEEQDGQYRAHRLAFFRLPHRLLIDDVVVLRRDHDRAAELLLDRVLKRLLIHIGQQVDLRIHLIHRFIDILIGEQ